MSESEQALLARAAQWQETHSATFAKVDWRALARSEGIDFATALLYLRLAHVHRPFLDRISARESVADRSPYESELASQPLVAIAPAAFYKEKPNSGADGRVVRAAATDAGLRCELIPLLSTGTLADNSAILLNWLAQRSSGPPLILVSLCKGGADVKAALASAPAETAFRRVGVWVNICGTLKGSPLAQWLLANKATFLAAWIWMKCHRQNFEFLWELRLTGPLAGPLTLPGKMLLISLAGFPLRRHLSNAYMRRCHRALAPMGPNDGGMLLAEVEDLPGRVYPIWGADHFFRPEERGRRVLRAIFEEIIGEMIARPHAPQLVECSRK